MEKKVVVFIIALFAVVLVHGQESDNRKCHHSDDKKPQMVRLDQKDEIIKCKSHKYSVRRKFDGKLKPANFDMPRKHPRKWKFQANQKLKRD
ncbi:MAG: hypothetical protein KDC84_01415 [Crocinitomicaceae bacterium]|nr:hypothetical protein [Crocinitomicaceae bacterium]